MTSLEQTVGSRESRRLTWTFIGPRGGCSIVVSGLIRRAVIVAVLAAGALLAAQQPASRQVEWPYYGGDPGGMKYSALTDIDATKVQRLQVAWEWKHWETPLAEFGTTPGFFEGTPLMIDGVLYVTTPYNSIAALDAETGRELWRFDGEAYKLGQILSGSGWKLRGTAFWRDGNKLRVFLNSRHRMFSLEPRTAGPFARSATPASCR